MAAPKSFNSIREIDDYYFSNVIGEGVDVSTENKLRDHKADDPRNFHSTLRELYLAHVPDKTFLENILLKLRLAKEI